MRSIVRFLFVLALAPLAGEAWARAPLTDSEARLARAAASGCTGSVFSSEEAPRSAADYLPSLPEAGDTATAWNEGRADDVYALASALLRPAVPAPERASDPSSLFVCPPAPAVAVRLLHLLAGPSPRALIGPTNTLYWLGLAYRRGVGAPADAAKARSFFLQARMFGHVRLTAVDWGLSPADDLMSLLRRPENRALLEDAAQAKWKGEAQLLLAELRLPEDPAQARVLLEQATGAHHRAAVRRLAALEADGTFGEARPLRAADLLAPWARSGNAEYEALLAVARRYNGPAGLPPASRQVTMEQLGRKTLLARAKAVERDSLVGRVAARGLLAPDGRILFVELLDPELAVHSIGRATLIVYRPEHLPRLEPERVEGRPGFAWVTLPPIVWR